MSINERLFNYLLNNIYEIIKNKYLSYGGWGKIEHKILKKKLNNEEKIILYDIISILLHNNLYVDQENIYIACFYYYYSSVVIDREDMMFKIIDIKSNIEKINIKFFDVNIDVNLCWSLIDDILCSNQIWASNIRKLVYFPSNNKMNQTIEYIN